MWGLLARVVRKGQGNGPAKGMTSWKGQEGKALQEPQPGVPKGHEAQCWVHVRGGRSRDCKKQRGFQATVYAWLRV